ncbi:MAG: thiamine phosphate synthase [Gammaproteobacteria bacterium]
MLTRLSGLYAITDSRLQTPNELATQVKLAVQGGARMVQYRDKSDDQSKRQAQVTALLTICREFSVPLIINDDIQLARFCGADGVHLGRTDSDLQTARKQLGDTAIIGVSCYNEWARAEQAVALGADYIAFGRFFASSTKPDAALAETVLLSRARKQLSLPVVAIGGITANNGQQLVNAGADMLAVIAGLFEQPDIEQTAQRFSRLFQPKQPRPIESS